MNKLFTLLACLLSPVLMKGQLYNNYKMTYSQSVRPAATISDDFYFKLREERRQQAEEYARLLERKEEMDLERTQATINRVKEVYRSVGTYPSGFGEGLYNVVSTNNYDFCQERQVYVAGDRVTRYFVGSEERQVISSSEIKNGKAIVKLNGSSDFLDIYFLEAMLAQ